MKKYKTYYDSELDTWVIDNRNIEKGDFDSDTKVITVESISPKIVRLHTLLMSYWITGNIDDMQIAQDELLKLIEELKGDE